MARNYKQLYKTMSLTGFYSEYLPPCFSLNEKVLLNPPVSDCDLIPPYSFTMSRFNGNDARRTLFIPEIGAYLAAQSYMDENDIIQELIEFSQYDEHSFSHILSGDETIVRHEQVYDQSPALGEEPSSYASVYIQNISEKLIRSAGAKKILKLDISNCYSSVYMHMMPAILLGVEQAEAEYKKYVRHVDDPSISPIYRKYRKLDEAIRRQNLNRTNGLLPGILSSRLIAEAILARVDLELEERGLHFVRYVDDYEVFLYDDNEKEAVSIFSQVINRYGFSLNYEKMIIVDFPFYVVENFESILGDKLKYVLPIDDMIDVFNTFFKLEQNGTKGAIRYLVKRFELQPMQTDMPKLYTSYLLTIMANNERSLSKCCSILVAQKDTYPLTQAEKDRIQKMLEKHLKAGHDLEVAWLLFLLIETGSMKKGDSIIQDALTQGQELSHVILLRRDLLTEEEISAVKEHATSWLLLYELYAADIITEEDFVSRLNLNKNLPMYQKFKHHKIHFVS